MSATAQLIRPVPRSARKRPIVICHCTTVHKELKSRSFHRQFLPLAELGFQIRYAAPMASRELPSGIKFIDIAPGPGLFRRLAWWPALFKKLLRQNADFYHVQDPQLLPLALLLKLIFRKRVVYDAYEDFPSIVAAKRSIPGPLRPLAAAIIDSIERAAARIFDAVITADPATMRRFARTGKKKKLVFYNFPNIRFFPAPRARFPKFDLVYRGGISERTGMFVLLDALRLLAARSAPPSLLLIGYFDSREAESRFRQRIAALGLSALIELRCRIHHESMAAALSEARIGLSPLLATPKFQKNIPVKVFEYWACGLPVVATDLRPIRPFFRDGEAGLLVQPGSAARLAEAIAWLLDHPESAHRMGARGRQLIVQRFNNANEVTKLGKFFECIACLPNGGHPEPCSNPL